MSTSVPVDDWINKFVRVAEVVVEGAKETIQEKAGVTTASQLQNKVEEVAERGKQLTKQAFKGAKEGYAVDVGEVERRQLEIQHPNMWVVQAAVFGSTATCFGIAWYLARQEVELRGMLRGMSHDWKADVSDGLIGPVPHMFRPFYKEVQMTVASQSSPTDAYVTTGLQWWSALCTVSARPTPMKLVYHGLMSVLHASTLMIRLRYVWAHPEAETIKAAARDMDAKDLDIESLAYQAALGVRYFLSGKPSKPTVTNSNETVPVVRRQSIIGSSLMLAWHSFQFLRCLPHHNRVAANVVAGIREKVVTPLLGWVPSGLSSVLEGLHTRLETVTLLSETASLLASAPLLLTYSTAGRLTATASLRLGLLGRLLAARHRFMDDTEHTVHNYASSPRMAIFANAAALGVLAVIRPRHSTEGLNFESAVAGGLAMWNLFVSSDVFSCPQTYNATTPAGVHPTVHTLAVSNLLCWVGVNGLHHILPWLITKLDRSLNSITIRLLVAALYGGVAYYTIRELEAPEPEIPEEVPPPEPEPQGLLNWISSTTSMIFAPTASTATTTAPTTTSAQRPPANAQEVHEEEMRTLNAEGWERVDH